MVAGCVTAAVDYGGVSLKLNLGANITWGHGDGRRVGKTPALQGRGHFFVVVIAIVIVVAV